MQVLRAPTAYTLQHAGESGVLRFADEILIAHRGGGTLVT